MRLDHIIVYSFIRETTAGKPARADVLDDCPGGNAGMETPVPISNTVVKHPVADGTAFRRESRTLPGLFSNTSAFFYPHT